MSKKILKNFTILCVALNGQDGLGFYKQKKSEIVLSDITTKKCR